MERRVYGGLSAQERTDRRQAQLLDAGRRVFAERGWAGSTVADVCRAASLSPRYFYELCGSREDLFLAVTAAIAQEVEQTVRATVAGPEQDPRARARAVLGALAALVAADPGTVRVALVESLATEGFRRHRSALLADLGALAARLMRALRDPALPPPDDARLALSAALLTGGLVELLVARATHERPGVPVDLDHLTSLWTAAAQL